MNNTFCVIIRVFGFFHIVIVVVVINAVNELIKHFISKYSAMTASD